jgi:hypothetical protein
LFLVQLPFVFVLSRHHALFQSPEVLEPGEHAIGLGAAGSAVLEPAVLPHEIDLFYRMGIDGNTDAGARLMYPHRPARGAVRCRIGSNLDI